MIGTDGGIQQGQVDAFAENGWTSGPDKVELYSDSKYVIDALEKGWARSWRAKGWINTNIKPCGWKMYLKPLQLIFRHCTRILNDFTGNLYF